MGRMTGQKPEACRAKAGLQFTPTSDERGYEYRCPVCYSVIPSEEIGRKVWCKKCGYLESCCNPI